ncbi:hypothetical protein [Metamycoplasma alkalescens]|nr:hypothetical protein [Metamycoplasma alkalescens]
MILIIFLTGYLKKQTDYRLTWSNAITVGTTIFLAIAIFVILFKKGFGKNLFKPMIDSYHQSRISKKAKTRYLLGMNQFEKDKILNQERQKYQNERNKKDLEKQKNQTTNLASFLLIAITLLTLIIGVVTIHYA